ncbi:hypothetical protein [Falsiroseomonas sp. CW058]|uniref:hypothetical protein n=1 Tax=Falsiroseomonas sp. CW058 TaxID=3388664 RepID=UPI003D319B20
MAFIGRGRIRIAHRRQAADAPFLEEGEAPPGISAKEEAESLVIWRRAKRRQRRPDAPTSRELGTLSLYAAALLALTQIERAVETEEAAARLDPPEDPTTGAGGDGPMAQFASDTSFVYSPGWRPGPGWDSDGMAGAGATLWGPFRIALGSSTGFGAMGDLIGRAEAATLPAALRGAPVAEAAPIAAAPGVEVQARPAPGAEGMDPVAAGAPRPDIRAPEARAEARAVAAPAEPSAPAARLPAEQPAPRPAGTDASPAARPVDGATAQTAMAEAVASLPRFGERPDRAERGWAEARQAADPTPEATESPAEAAPEPSLVAERAPPARVAPVLERLVEVIAQPEVEVAAERPGRGSRSPTAEETGPRAAPPPVAEAAPAGMPGPGGTNPAAPGQVTADGAGPAAGNPIPTPPGQIVAGAVTPADGTAPGQGGTGAAVPGNDNAPAVPPGQVIAGAVTPADGTAPGQGGTGAAVPGNDNAPAVPPGQIVAGVVTAVDGGFPGQGGAGAAVPGNDNAPAVPPRQIVAGVVTAVDGGFPGQGGAGAAVPGNDNMPPGRAVAEVAVGAGDNHVVAPAQDGVAALPEAAPPRLSPPDGSGPAGPAIAALVRAERGVAHQADGAAGSGPSADTAARAVAGTETSAAIEVVLGWGRGPAPMAAVAETSPVPEMPVLDLSPPAPPQDLLI